MNDADSTSTILLFASLSPSWQFASMIKTQIQIPDELYRGAKRVAADYEMSFAEVVLRSLERALPG